MADRVTGAEVLEILDTDLTAGNLQPFITAANLIVTDILGGSGTSVSLLKEIERWLSAHFAAIRDPRIQQEKIGDASAIYQGKTGMGLESTLYGQQVKILDTSGALANIGKRKSGMKVLDFIDGGT